MSQQDTKLCPSTGSYFQPLVLPGQAVHKLFDTQLSDKDLSHAGIWVENFLLGHLPSHFPSYAAVYWSGEKKKTHNIYFCINSKICIQFTEKRPREVHYLPEPKHC